MPWARYHALVTWSGGTSRLERRSNIDPVKVDIPPDQISPSNLACLNRILDEAKYFAQGHGLRSTGSSDATNDIHFCSAGRNHPGTSAFLVSTRVLRQYGLLPGCLRPVSGNRLWLALCPHRQPVSA